MSACFIKVNMHYVFVMKFGLNLLMFFV